MWLAAFTCFLGEWVCEPAAEGHGVQVYAAEAEVAESQAKESKSSAGKRAEEAWNERIKGAYAAIAAATPYTPATKKPNSHALSWHRCATPKDVRCAGAIPCQYPTFGSHILFWLAALLSTQSLSWV